MFKLVLKLVTLPISMFLGMGSLALGSLLFSMSSSHSNALFKPDDGYFFSAWFLLMEAVALSILGGIFLYWSYKMTKVSREEAKQAVKIAYKKL